MTITQLALPHPALVRQQRVAARYAAALARLDVVDRTDAWRFVRACQWCDVWMRALYLADRESPGPPLSPERAWFRHDRRAA
jgi:hypothetical protein